MSAQEPESSMDDDKRNTTLVKARKAMMGAFRLSNKKDLDKNS